MSNKTYPNMHARAVMVTRLVLQMVLAMGTLEGGGACSTA